MKLKLIAAAALAVASGSASAVLDDYLTGNGELFFNIYDPLGAKTSFVFDLTPLAGSPALGTFNMADFLPAGAGGTPAGTIGAVEAPGTTFQWTLTGGVWQEFLSNAAINRDALRWNVVAGDNTGNPGTTVNNRRFLTTSPADSFTLTSTQAGNLGTTNSLPTAVNASPAGGQADPSVVFTDAAPGYFATAFGENWKGNLGTTNSTAAVGQEMSFFYITNRSTTAGGPIVEKFDNGTWSFAIGPNNQGILTYAVPVPEPGTWAMLGAGLLAIGAIARRRVSA